MFIFDNSKPIISELTDNQSITITTMTHGGVLGSQHVWYIASHENIILLHCFIMYFALRLY
jgi:dihydrodipicolinate reductase